jgi:hypothetical protein
MTRIPAAAVGGGGVVVALALVWFFRPPPEPTFEDAADAALTALSVANVSPTNPMPTAESPAASLQSDVPRAPLPGEALATPMAQALIDLALANPGSGAGDRVSAQLEGEREFGAEPLDAGWAPGAEVELLAKVAQVPGLKLIDLQVQCRSTMCRLQLTQPHRIPGEVAGPPFLLLLNSLGMEPRWMMTVPDGYGGPSASTRSFAYLWREGFAPEGAAHDTN